MRWEVLQRGEHGPRSWFCDPVEGVSIIVGGRSDGGVGWTLYIASNVVDAGQEMSGDLAKAAAERAWRLWLLRCLLEMEEP